MFLVKIENCERNFTWAVVVISYNLRNVSHEKFTSVDEQFIN